MRHFHSTLATLLLAAGASSCSLDSLFNSCPRDQVCVDGTAQFFSFEGGFWAVRGDDNVTYDPIDGLPEDFRQSGLRVRLRARVRHDVGSFHMAGPIVDIISIRKLP